MYRIETATVLALAMVVGSQASAQDVGECTSKAYKTEASERSKRCTQPDPRARAQCVDRLAATRSDAIERCHQQQNARAEAQAARAREAAESARRRANQPK